jgi:hypothetical protein
LACVNWTNVGLSMIGGAGLNAWTKGAAKWYNNGSSWRNRSREMTRDRIHIPGAGEQRHHWLLQQNQGIGKYFSDGFKNQPWNINPIGSGFNNWLGRRPGMAWLGGPLWAGEGSLGLGVAGGGLLVNRCSCN